MNAVQTLEYDDPHLLQRLFANDTGLLKKLGESLALKVTTRDGWIRFEGDEGAVKQGVHFFRELEKMARHGMTISAHEFELAMQSVIEENDAMDAMIQTAIEGAGGKDKVAAKTPGQIEYLQAIEEKDVVFALGPAGTGKTYLAVAKAVQALRNHQVKRIILTRPAVEAGEALGFLPGDLKEKILPYLRPLYDALYDRMEPEEVAKVQERGQIEVAPLAYMRGRTLNQAFVILDEAQNTTQAQMLMFLTRLGFGSKAIITGDPTQIDLQPRHASGLLEAREALRDTNEVAFISLGKRDVVRHQLVRHIIAAYEKHRGQEE